MFSVVCVFNNKKVLDSCLLNSLREQTGHYELFLIDNTKNKFKSAAKALNLSQGKVKNEYIIFVHQDVVILSNNWLKQAENYLKNLSNVGIAGVVGAIEINDEKKMIRNQIIDRGVCSGGYNIKKPEIVQTLDECLLIIPKKVFELYKFDEKVCDNWHLYGVDFCLSIKNEKFNVYVLPLNIHHKSLNIKEVIQKKETSLNLLKRFEFPPSDYFKTLKKVLRKHKKNYYVVYTTCGIYKTHIPLLFQRVCNVYKEIIILVKLKLRKV